MSSRNFYKMIKKLTAEQVNAVKSIGFEHILKLDVMDCPRRIGRYLVDNFDYVSHSLILEKGSLMISELDVFCTLGFPRGNFAVREAPHQKTDEYAEFVKAFKLRWKQEISSVKKKEEEMKGKKTKKSEGKKKVADKEDDLDWPITSLMCKVLEDRDDFGDEFKIDFVVCLISTIVKGQQNYFCNSKILYSLMDVNAIKSLNWCQYTFESLVCTVEDFKKNNAGNFKGPLLFLLLCYVDRVEFKAREVPRKFPTLCGWNDKILKKRCREEEEEGFGKGYIADPFNVGEYNIGKDILQICAAIGEDVKEASDIISGAVKKISGGIADLGKALNEKGSCIFHTDVSKKSLLAVSDFFNTVSSFDLQPTTTEETDAFWDQPDVVQALIEMADVANTAGGKLKERVVEKNRDSVEISRERSRIDVPPTGTPSFSLHLNLTPSPNPSPSSPADCEVGDCEVDDDVFEEVSDRDDDRALIIGERAKRPVKNLSRYMRSPYWAEMWYTLADVNLKERIVSDYCFIEEYSKSELLFSHGSVFVTREDMLTLRKNEEVSTGVIDAFVYILNSLNLKRAASDVHRVFFSSMVVYHLTFQSKTHPLTKAEQIKNFENQLKAELQLYNNVTLDGVYFVFFPIYDSKRNHFIVICFNVKGKVVEIMDNHVLPGKTTVVNKYRQLPNDLVDAFSNFLKKKKIKIHDEIRRYPVKLAKMPWRSNDNKKDCGIFVMRHLETYRGQTKWECGLKKNDL